MSDEDRIKTGIPELDDALEKGISPTGRTLTGPALQRMPPRTQEAKDLAAAFGKGPEDIRKLLTGDDVHTAAAKLGLDADYPSMEARVAQSMVDTFSKKQVHIPIPKNSMVLEGAGADVHSGATRVEIAPGYIGVTRSRREVVEEAVSKLGRAKIVLLAQYKSIPENGNRRTRNVAKALLRKIKTFLPKGVTLDEALQVLR